MEKTRLEPWFLEKSKGKLISRQLLTMSFRGPSTIGSNLNKSDFFSVTLALLFRVNSATTLTMSLV